MFEPAFVGPFLGGPAVRSYLLGILACLMSTVTMAANSPAPTFQAGAATSNITPPLGAEIIGGFAPFPSTNVHDELHAKCLVLDDGQTKLALVVLDLLGIDYCVSVEARKLIEQESGIPAPNVLISAIHTHSAASAMGTPIASRYTYPQKADDYQHFVARRIADGVKCAANRLRPAQLGFATAQAPEHVFNRRWFLKPGTMPPNPFGGIDQGQDEPRGGQSKPGQAGRPDRPHGLDPGGAPARRASHRRVLLLLVALRGRCGRGATSRPTTTACIAPDWSGCCMATSRIRPWWQ